MAPASRTASQPVFTIPVLFEGRLFRALAFLIAGKHIHKVRSSDKVQRVTVILRVLASN